jgi:hypothetical protein
VLLGLAVVTTLGHGTLDAFRGQMVGKLTTIVAPEKKNINRLE